MISARSRRTRSSFPFMFIILFLDHSNMTPHIFQKPIVVYCDFQCFRAISKVGHQYIGFVVVIHVVPPQSF